MKATEKWMIGAAAVAGVTPIGAYAGAQDAAEAGDLTSAIGAQEIASNRMVNPTTGSVGDGVGAPRNGHSHDGYDVFNEVGTPIGATCKGKVVGVTNGACGTGRIIEHYNTDGSVAFRTTYCHLADSSVQVNQFVSRGQVIGHMGRTGNITGADPTQLHFSVKEPDGGPVDLGQGPGQQYARGKNVTMGAPMDHDFGKSLACA